MADKPYFPKITASSVEDFQALENEVKKFPQKIIDQIEVVHRHVYITCQIKELFDLSKYVVIPNFTTQITPSKSGEHENTTEVSIYAGDFLFKINWKYKKDALINYAFVECENFKKKDNGNN